MLSDLVDFGMRVGWGEMIPQVSFTGTDVVSTEQIQYVFAWFAVFAFGFIGGNK